MTPTVVVVGAGFSGTMTAVHLLRSRIGAPLRLVLIDRRGPAGRGVAYGTRLEAHRLNVPTAAMSALPDDPESFLRFARRRDPAVIGGSFLPRRLYGEYLEHTLSAAEAEAPATTRLDRIVDDVCGIDIDRAAPGMVVRLGRGDAQRADRVVLALGNSPPAIPPTRTPAFYASARYVRDPWAPGALTDVRSDDRVLLIGAGLTMVDVVLDLEARGVTAQIHVVSRRGLLPQSHRSPAVAPTREHLPPGLDHEPATAIGYLRAVRRHVRRLAPLGIDWREVIGALRPATPDLWRALDDRERSRFLRHARPFWEAHRHRAAPAAWERVEALRAAGRVVVRAGRILQYAERADGVDALVQARGGRTAECLSVTRVINCTGPAGDLSAVEDPLWHALLAAGMLRPDRHRLGVETAPDGTLLDHKGAPIPNFYYVGPLLRATHWEATAVPELRCHAARVAEHVAHSLRG
jgi:uncharacterized NAD(P)/FAD-binding protein YdhS